MPERDSRHTYVYLDSTPATVEWQTKLDQPFVTGVGQVARGPIRLVIDMPARSAARLLAAVLAASLSFATLALTWGALDAIVPSRLEGPSWTLPAAAIGVFMLLGLLWASRAGAKREVVEVDSRFVSLARGGVVLEVQMRSACTEVNVRSPDSVRWIERISNEVHWLTFGTADQVRMVTGGGVSHQTATELAERIRKFMSAHPAHQEYGYPGS